jgi:hypothetical protein
MVVEATGRGAVAVVAATELPRLASLVTIIARGQTIRSGL